MDMENDTSYFLDLIRRSHRGRFKIYIGMIAGVGKNYRMLQDAREMLRQGTKARRWKRWISMLFCAYTQRS